MWYRYSNLNEIDSIAEKIKNMSPYSVDEHMNLLSSPRPPKELLPESIEDRMQLLYENAEKSRNYLSTHPQIYLYPSSNEKIWRYLLFDPKHLRRMENSDYYENLSTPISINDDLNSAIQYIHKKYPTALIDYYNSEEEMLEDQ